jgi:hypothetical protein
MGWCGMPINILLVLIALVPTAVAWMRWLGSEQRSLQGRRKVLFVVGLCAVSLALLEYCFFIIYTYYIGGFGTNFPGMLRWARPGLWVSLLAFLLVIAGRGMSRVFGLSASVVMLILWLVPIWGI